MGVASIRCVRPVLITSWNSRDFSSSTFQSLASAGSRSRSICTTAETCSAVGITSLLDWPKFTWSLGWTGSPLAFEASRAMTSFAFMLEEVPLPVWNTSIGNWSSHFPSATSSADFSMASASFGSTSLSPRFTRAAAALMSPSVCTNGAGSGRPEMGKFSTARWVCGPHSAAAGTFISPRLSFSVRKSDMGVLSGAAEPGSRGLDQLVAVRDGQVRPQAVIHGTILLRGQPQRILDRRAREVPPGEPVGERDGREPARVVRGALAAHFHLVAGDLLTLLAHHLDDVHGLTRGERREQVLHRVRGAAAGAAVQRDRARGERGLEAEALALHRLERERGLQRGRGHERDSWVVRPARSTGGSSASARSSSSSESTWRRFKIWDVSCSKNRCVKWSIPTSICFRRPTILIR